MAKNLGWIFNPKSTKCDTINLNSSALGAGKLVILHHRAGYPEQKVKEN